MGKSFFLIWFGLLTIVTFFMAAHRPYSDVGDLLMGCSAISFIMFVITALCAKDTPHG